MITVSAEAWRLGHAVLLGLIPWAAIGLLWTAFVPAPALATTLVSAAVMVGSIGGAYRIARPTYGPSR